MIEPTCVDSWLDIPELPIAPQGLASRKIDEGTTEGVSSLRKRKRTVRAVSMKRQEPLFLAILKERSDPRFVAQLERRLRQDR